mgnify:CR=1 FL=1
MPGWIWNKKTPSEKDRKERIRHKKFWKELKESWDKGLIQEFKDDNARTKAEWKKFKAQVEEFKAGVKKSRGDTKKARGKKKYSKGGKVTRGDGIAKHGRTKGRII